MKYYLLFLVPIFIFIINFFFKKHQLVSNYSGEKHQAYVGKKNIPLSGGIFLISSFIFLNNFYFLSFFVFLIFMIGLASDTNFLSSPKLRLFIQSIIVFLFVYLFNVQIGQTRIYFLDMILNNILLGYLFSSFCLLIVINGSNFIDGLNGLVLGYYLTITSIMFKLGFLRSLGLDDEKIFFFILVIICLFLFNIFNDLYIGDSGAYLLGFIFGYVLIMIYQLNQFLSPYFIVLLLWYPCFENLFSIMRKYQLKKSPTLPDTKHFHQLLFYFIKKKFAYSNFASNNLASFTIIFYNLLVFLIGSNFFTQSKILIILIIFNIITYIFLYKKLLFYK